MDYLIKNGTVVTASDEFEADVLIQDGKISMIGNSIQVENAKVIDASGKYIFPGGIDQQVNYSFEHKGEKVRGFETSNAAIVGGTTTVIESINQEKGKGIAETINKYDKKKFAKNAMVDYTFHGVICDPVERTFTEIPLLPNEGISTVKLFMAHKGLPFHSDDTSILKALSVAKKGGVTVMLHAENGAVIDVLQQKYLDRGEVDPIYDAISRPPLVEVEATERAIRLAEIAGAPVYIVNVSAKDSMEVIRNSYNNGAKVYGETCTHYLVLDRNILDNPDVEGAKYVCSPALRKKIDRENLWNAINKGWLNAVSSDHYGFNWKEKKHMGVDNFTKIPDGLPGVQDRLGILWTYGVNHGKITKQRLVDLYATTPAKINGLDHRKGHIGIGYDADLVIYDPEPHLTISNETSLHGVDYNLYEGMKQEGKVDKVFLRGKLMVDDGEFVGKRGDGKRIDSKPYGLSYEGMI